MTKESYNNEPVFYCKKCLSLAIVNEGDGSYCNDCGCSAIGATNIDRWSGMYHDMYGKDFLTGELINNEECEHSEHSI